jgi:hypothetical protein
MFTPIKKKTKWLGDPWTSSHCGRGYWAIKADPAWWINRLVDDIAWNTGFTQFYQWVDMQISWKLHGKFVCPQRSGGISVFGYEHDWWRFEANGERACSYCGSCNPTDFEKFLRRVVEDTDIHVTVSMADGCHKVYMSRPNHMNASFGPIKFYGVHAPRDEKGQVAQAHYDLLKPALRVSREKFEKQMSHFKKQA